MFYLRYPASEGPVLISSTLVLYDESPYESAGRFKILALEGIHYAGRVNSLDICSPGVYMRLVESLQV